MTGLTIKPEPAVLEVDVDGPELEVLQGALGILQEHRLPLAVELSTEGEPIGHTAAELLEFVRDLGYSTYASRMKFARVVEIKTLTDLERLPVRLERREVANLFCTPEAVDIDAVWPAKFVPDAYSKHYLSEDPVSFAGIVLGCVSARAAQLTVALGGC
jgi:Methyltransferase FkbM domain